MVSHLCETALSVHQNWSWSQENPKTLKGSESERLRLTFRPEINGVEGVLSPENGTNEETLEVELTSRRESGEGYDRETED